jgi:hypothetical protein
MEMILDRSVACRLPRLADAENVALPQPLLDAHARLTGLANDVSAKATAVAGDVRISETERVAQWRALHNATASEIAKLSEIVTAVEATTTEHEAAALLKAVGAFDPARLLSIAERVGARPRESRLNSYLRARSDRELAAALIAAPAELGCLEGIDARVCDVLRDQLIDSADPKLRASIAATRFAVARARAGIEFAGAHVNRITKTEQPMRERLVRVARKRDDV